MQRRRGHALGVDLEVAAECFARIAATEPVGAEWNEGTSGPARDLVGQGLDVIRRGHDRRVTAEDLRDIGKLRLRFGVQAVEAFDLERLVAEKLVARHAPHVGGDLVPLLQKLLSAEDLPHDRARSEERDAAPKPFFALAEEVEAPNDPVLDALGHRRLGIVLVVEGEVVEDVLAALTEHAADAVFDDDRRFVREGWIVRADVRERRREEMAVAVLVLQALTVERRPPRGRAAHEAPAPRIAEGPDLIARSLESEHRIEDVERQHRLAVRRVARARGGERGHRARLGDALLEHLAVLRLAIGEQRLGVDRLVPLPQW